MTKALLFEFKTDAAKTVSVHRISLVAVYQIIGQSQAASLEISSTDKIFTRENSIQGKCNLKLESASSDEDPSYA